MRRKLKENNFKVVLEIIWNLMNIDCVVFDWLYDIILGYGDLSSVYYLKMFNQIVIFDFNDIFFFIEYLKVSFFGYNVKVIVEDFVL